VVLRKAWLVGLAAFGLSIADIAKASSVEAPIATASDPGVGLTQLSLEDLLSSDVTSVAKKRQTVSEAAAAVFVIGQEDIRRSGVKNIPELLRMAPGVEVAAVGGGGYSVGIRGFDGRFSNKVLVLIDGRSIYLSTLSSVLWDQQLTPVEDIERIEVVRGPGGAIWGANAVDGVINIITNHAVDTQGGAATVQADDKDGMRAFARYGARVGATGVLRVYATGSQQRDIGENLYDRRDGLQTGFRYDAEPSETDSFTLQGDAQTGDFKTVSNAITEGAFTDDDSGRSSDANLLARWTRDFDATNGLTVQAYFDRVTRSEYGLHASRDQYDIDISDHFLLGSRQSIVWGVEYRRDQDHTTAGLFSFSPASQIADWYGAFVQDEIAIAPKLKVSIGGKLEHNIYSGLELQPSIRAIWKESDWSVWGAVSRSVRTPSRFEADVLIAPSTPSQLTESLATSVSTSEKVVAYELGWRRSLSPRIDVDLAGYHNDYIDLLIHEPLYVDGAPVALVTVPIGSGHSTGAEAALNAKMTDRWTLKFAGDLLDLKIKTGLPTGVLDPFVDQGLSPRSQLSIRSWFDLTPDIDVDLWLRHVSSLERGATPAYTNLDLRVAWRLTTRLELTARGENLLGPQRTEMAPVGGAAPTLVQRRAELGFAARF
ncbi:MAG: TonB-dependent receptor plug domain-containing protein, partial [Caulobacteraceae bacterium]